MQKLLKTARDYGNRVVFIKGEDCKDAADQTIDFVNKLKERNIVKSYSDIALLFRSVKYHSNEYIEALQNSGIPFIVYGLGNLLERDDIRAIRYFMAFLTQNYDEDKSFKMLGNWWDVSQFTSDFLSFSPETKEVLINVKQDFTISNFKKKKALVRHERK